MASIRSFLPFTSGNLELEEKALSQMNTEQITKLLKRMINQVLHSK